jgi:hypothetical protein
MNDAPETPRSPSAPGEDSAQRIWMNRARQNAELAGQTVERPWWPRLVGLAMSLALVALVMYAFHSFLSVLGRYLDTPIEDAPATQSEGAGEAGSAEATMPVFVVPSGDGESDGSAGADRPAEAQPDHEQGRPADQEDDRVREHQ